MLFRQENTSKEKEIDYLNVPDGEQVAEKLWYVLKPAAGLAVFAGTFDVIAWSQPKTLLGALGRFAHFSFPILGVSSTFVLTSNAVGSLRKKDDIWNWVIAGFAAGSVMGIWRRRRMEGFNYGLLFALGGAIRKDTALKGMGYYLPENHVQMEGLKVHDFTLTKHIPGNWTSGK
ncbi:unnamed protein product [Phyllotreta striolata]|uniref:NADH dehydrogenase [ubiquinone] 1 alpha subcomplex subunit 11 n=1 Tax=Phyllotreta striolata TaxID=444603 RepID=A0A9N9XMN8_PHYSR|nr:unnamed protein product [Phyllotreta striolata]